MTLGVVLAGGTSARMGRSKADLPFEGRTFLDRVGFALDAVCDDVVVAGSSNVAWPEVPDLGEAHRGPLSGIVTALGLDRDILVCAVDHPLVRVETLRGLLTLADSRPVVPVHESIPQPTVAWYPGSVRDHFASVLAADGFIRRALDDIPVRWVHEEEWRAWGEDGSSWHSVDTPDAYATL
ncbi:MAG: molybdenum cofactor guanylyltransferase [Acidimicrobiia bacterium]|nr:molybdenum cofactor guanylyltransferase [Acidimicrobiia bacterium]